jgi:drug/metabolite transporter (DMT)-like permease
MAKISLSSSPEQWKAGRGAIWAAMIAVYVAWGSTYLAIRFSVETMPPFLMAAARFLVAGTLLFLVRRAAGDRLPTWEQVRAAGVVGIFLLLGGNGAVVWAEQTVPSGLAALMVSSSPLWMLMLDAARPGGRKPGRAALVGVGVGFLGVLLLLWPGGSGGLLQAHPWGAAALLFAALAWSFGSIYSRYAPLPASPLMGSAVEMLIGGAALFLMGVLTGEPARLDLAGISTRSWFGLVYLIVFGSLIGFTAYTWLLRVAPTSLVSTYAYVNPLVALIIGALLGNELLSSRTLAAAAVILGSVALITSGAGRKGRPSAGAGAETAGLEQKT